MINRRAPRPSRAVENLQQFCLNNSAGIDCTAPHSNVKNVYDSTNLVPNPDGSLSLRKPLFIKRDWTKLVNNALDVADIAEEVTIVNVFPMYTGDAYLVYFKSDTGYYITLFDSGFAQFTNCTLKWTDFNKTEHSKLLLKFARVYVNEDSLESIVDLSTAKTFHSNTSTVLGNCFVVLNSAQFTDEDGKSTPLVDVSLYGSFSETSLAKPRFVKLFRNELKQWCFEIHNPETSVLEFDSNTETYSHPIDTLLDDPYNLQDTYDAAAPNVKSIVPYAFTTIANNNVVLTPHTIGESTVTFPHSFKTVQHNGSEFIADYVYPFNESTVTKTHTYITDVGTFVQEHVGHVSYLAVGTSTYDLRVRVRFKLKFTPAVDLKTITLTMRGAGSAASKTYYTDPNFPEFSGPTVNFPVKTKTETFSDLKKGTTVELSDGTHDIVTMSLARWKFTYTMSGEFVVDATWETSATVNEQPNPDSVTRAVAQSKYRGVNLFPNNIDSTNASIYLKAFCNFPKPTSLVNYYATWLYTYDGIVWQNALHHMPEEGDAPAASYENAIDVTTDELPIENVDTGVDENKNSNTTAITTVYAPLFTTANGKSILNRIDLLEISESFLKKDFANASFRFKIVSVQGAGTAQSPYKIVGTYGQADYVPVYSQKGEYWYSDFGNSVLGEKLYHKSRIFSFGDSSFKNNIFVSEPGEFVIPFKNTIDINASEDSVVTSIHPWKDYLFISTPQSLYLATQVDSGYLIKTANAVLGVTQNDAKCAVPTLNGIVFKSGSKVYMFYPNIYAGDDSVINVTDISSPVEHLLEGFDGVSGAFAFGTNSEYVLMLPKSQGTLCLSYDYNTRVWTKTEYPVRFTKHTVYSLTDIVLFGQNPEGDFCEYHYNKTFVEAYGNDVGAPYGDVLVESENGILQDVLSYGTTNSTLEVSPIAFGLDTGQKADAIVTTKQFVETKFVLATLDKADAFPMQLTVHIDGDPHIITRDISTDAAFWKDSSAKGILNTTFSGLSDKSDIFNVLRQLVVRYSGKGKSIRHILEGQSLSNFKLYETYIRYKLLNVKQ